MLESILQDVRYAAGSLARRPGTTVLAVGILALGLGINTAVLAVSCDVLWKPLPYPHADRLVTIAQVYTEDGSESGVRLHQFDEWNRRLRTMRVAGHDTRERVVRGPGPARVLEVATVSEDFFEVLGVPAAQGLVPRLATGDVRAVISTTFARVRETETGRSALGQAVTVGEGRYEVAAVMPGEFAFPSADVNVWLAARAVAPDESGWYEVVGRMRDGATLAQAREDAIRVAHDIRDVGDELWSAATRSVEETLRGELRSVVRVSIAAALLVFVVAYVNTVVLLIGRSVLRRREFAVRLALGSGMARLARAALVEGLALAAGGLILGLAVAWVGLRLFAAASAGLVPGADVVAIERPIFLAGLVLTVLAGAVCGGATVAGAIKDGGGTLRASTAATGSRTARRLRAGLVAGQIALSIVLMTGAGLLVRTVDRLLDEENGFEPQQALTARLMLADTRFIDGTTQTAFVDTLLERVRGLPGVQAAGVGSLLPPEDSPMSVLLVYTVEDDNSSSRDSITLSFGAVTPGYFAALGTRLAAGRRFDAAANLAEVAPVMLSETAARFVYSNEDPIGRSMPYGVDVLDIARGESPVIAVVDDVKYEGLAAPRAGSVYVPWQRVPTGVGRASAAKCSTGSSGSWGEGSRDGVRKCRTTHGRPGFVAASRASSRHFQWQSTSLKPIALSQTSWVSTSSNLFEGSSSSGAMPRRARKRLCRLLVGDATCSRFRNAPRGRRSPYASS